MSIVAMLLLLGLLGCSIARGPGGPLRLQSRTDTPVILKGDFSTAYYDTGGRAAETSFYLSDVGLERLLRGPVQRGSVVHIDLLWMPKAGATPMDSSATNASIRYLIMVDGEIGVYAGAGFCRPHGEAGDQRLTITVREASLNLLEATDGFIDLLGPTELSGSFTATLSDLRTRQMRFAVSQIVTDALGKSRLMRNDQPGDEPGEYARALKPTSDS